jgi:hypothetical protein
VNEVESIACENAAVIFKPASGATLVAPSAGLFDVTDGPALWIVHVELAGVASVLPAASVARTWNVWLPATRPL